MEEERNKFEGRKGKRIGRERNIPEGQRRTRRFQV